MKISNFPWSLIGAALLAAGFFHETAREAAHYFLWIFYGIGAWCWLFLDKREINEVLAGVTWLQVLISVPFSIVIMVAIIAHGWPVLATLKLGLILQEVRAYYEFRA